MATINLDKVKATLKEGYAVKLETIDRLGDIEGMIVYHKQDDILGFATTLESIEKMLRKGMTSANDPYIHTKKYGRLLLMTLWDAAALGFKQVKKVKEEDLILSETYYNKDMKRLSLDLSHEFDKERLFSTQRMIVDDTECYKTISLSPSVVKKVLRLLGKPNNRRFLDLGCGIGNVTTWAAIKGFKTYGLDINPFVIDKAKELEKQFNVTTEYTIGNMLDSNFLANYIKSVDPDIIYTYSPICGRKEMQQVLDVIVDNIKPGCIIAAYLVNGAYMRKRERQFKCLSDSIVQVL